MNFTFNDIGAGNKIFPCVKVSKVQATSDTVSVALERGAEGHT